MFSTAACTANYNAEPGPDCQALFQPRQALQKDAHPMNELQEIRIPALAVRQGKSRCLYSFALDGKKISEFATISRIKRSKAGKIEGYQRPEVVSHIREIRTYLESDDPMIPNALVIAFDDRVRFEAGGESDEGAATPGSLIIPIDPTLDDTDKPGWVVDGQQRLAAIREADIDEFPICVIGFIAGDATEQTEQFILVNSTKPLPKGLIYELLPTTGARLPTLLERRRFPAHLLARLNTEENSPLMGMIHTPTVPEGIIKDNSVLKMLEHSLSDGVLYRFKTRGENDGDEEAMLEILNAFWSTVAEIFPEAWGISPKHSRLMHGAGIVSLGFVMDAIADRYRKKNPGPKEFRKNLEPLAEHCRWTEGYWDFGPGQQRKWNEIQNTQKDIQLLSNFLLVQYRSQLTGR